MSDFEKNKNLPYNIKEKSDKQAAYRSLIRAELADELFDKILNIIVVEKRYREATFSAKDLAKELKTNTRYISAVINSRFNTNFSCLLNEYRIKEALHRMVDKRYAEENIEDISNFNILSLSAICLSLHRCAAFFGQRIVAEAHNKADNSADCSAESVTHGVGLAVSLDQQRHKHNRNCVTHCRTDTAR